ncbi:MAG: YceI family protein [Flavobacteriales bacterium]|nr:YceI family protein [Flavobacteriales bacterium]
MNNRIINAIVLLIAFGFVGYYGFKSYLNSNKYKSQVTEAETTVNGTQAETSSGVTLNNFNHLVGLYQSEITDPKTTDLVFKTYGTTATVGTFKDFSISANFNGTDQFDLNVTIDVSTIYTAESTRDEHLQSEEFFNVAKFNAITYSAIEIVAGDTSFIAKGNINFLGVSSPLDVPFVYVGSANGKENTEVFKGAFEFIPSNFGMVEDAGNVSISFYTELRKSN